MLRFQLQNPSVMQPCPLGFAQLLGIQVRQGEMSARLGRTRRQSLFQFDGRVTPEASLLQNDGKIEPCFYRNQVHHQRLLVSGQRLGQITRFKSSHSEVVMCLKKRRVRLGRFAMSLSFEPNLFLGFNRVMGPDFSLAG